MSRAYRGLRWLAVAMLAAGVTRPLHAENGTVVQVPLSDKGEHEYSRQSGLQLTVDTTWAGNHGYRPVVFELSATHPLVADVQLTIQFFARSSQNGERSIVVEQDFELARGTSDRRLVLSVPQTVSWQTFGWNVWVDGQPDAALSAEGIGFAGNRSSRNFAGLVLGDAAERRYRRLFREIRGGPADLLRREELQLLAFWLDYTHFDVVVLTARDLRTACKEQQEKISALLRWVRSGGNLWILEAGTDYAQIDAVDSALHSEAPGETGDRNLDQLADRGWKPLRLDNPVTDELEKLRQLVGPRPTGNDAMAASSEPVDSREWFVTRLFGLGTVTAFRDFAAPSDDNNQNVVDLGWAVTHSLVADRLEWEDRHGTNPDAGNDSFNDFLIPNVGSAPVTAFQVLLSLFVIVIGPVNYVVLRRREQLPLLLVTIPVAAVTTTGVLFAYSFLGEGTGVQVRARSFTLLDQRTDEAVSWARLSYYAGVARERDLRFPVDTAVYPILPSTRTGNYRLVRRLASQQREVLWGDEQHLGRGWLPARTPTQLLTVSARPSHRAIQFAVAGDALTATNRLGVPIRTLVVCDQEGAYHVAEDIADGEQRPLAPSTQIMVLSQLRSLLSDSEPEFPAGSTESLSTGLGTERFPMPSNLMEVQMSAITGLANDLWAPGTYVAITERGVDVAIGRDDFVEKSSFHLVRGRW